MRTHSETPEVRNSTQEFGRASISFIRSPADGYLGCFYPLAVLNNTAMNIDVKYLFGSLASVLLVIELEIKLLDHLVILYLVF